MAKKNSLTFCMDTDAIPSLLGMKISSCKNRFLHFGDEGQKCKILSLGENKAFSTSRHCHMPVILHAILHLACERDHAV